MYLSTYSFSDCVMYINNILKKFSIPLSGFTINHIVHLISTLWLDILISFFSKIILWWISRFVKLCVHFILFLTRYIYGNKTRVPFSRLFDPLNILMTFCLYYQILSSCANSYTYQQYIKCPFLPSLEHILL